MVQIVATPYAAQPANDTLLMFLEQVPEGYFAVRHDTNEPWAFFRIARPNFGRYKGCIKIQSKHSEQLVDRWIYYPMTHRVLQHQYRDRDIESYVMLIVADWHGATMEYARAFNRCGCCSKELTDERSRWYGVGPECEKKPRWAFAVEDVDNSDKGPFILGVSDRDS